MVLARLAIVALILVVAAGCAVGSTPSAAPDATDSDPTGRSAAPPTHSVPPAPSLRGINGDFASIEGANVLSRGPRVVDPGVSHDELVELAKANSEFALDLYRNLAAHSDENIFLGPHSISTALAMIYAGARGETATDMARVLHWKGMDDVFERFNALDFALASREQPGAVELRLANQAFAQPGLPLVESYLETLSTQFGAPLAELDFSEAERARSVINDWVAGQTNDRIEELFPPETIHEARGLYL